nr:choice-of-anchor A family protein [Paenibacillus artemisiicola]
MGVANDFNVFVLGNHTQSFVDAGGRVAVGGKATYRGYGIGSALNVSATRADLIVGGSMDIIGGTNFSGNSVIAPGGTIVNYTMTNNNGVLPQPQTGTPVDFAAAGQYLTCASASWGALAPTGTVSVAFGTITLTGTGPTLNIFSLNGANVAGSGVSLATANGINIVTPPGSTVLVNIAGNGVGFGSYAMFINGGQSSPSNGAVILWNFYQATSAFNLNLSIKGSVLAPLAVWSAVGFGNIDGTMAAQSFVNTTGSLEAHTIPFVGCLPEVACTPTLTIRKTVNGGASFAGTAGTPLTYVIQVINTGGGVLTNVQISDPLLGFSQTVPSLASGQEVDFTIQSQVQPGTPGSSYVNTAFVQSNQTPQQSGSVTITIQGFLDVSLIKTADRTSAAPGDTVQYTFTVVNPGGAALQNATLTDAALGLSLSFPSFVSGTIATVPYTIPANAVIGSTFVNTGVLNASNLASPVSAQASVLITETPSVLLTKTADRATALPGDTIQYTVTVSNDSQVTPVFNLRVTDPLLSLDQIIPQLNAQASSVFNGMYAVPPGTPAGTVITNTSVLQSSLGTQSATVQVTVAPLAAISIAKTPRRPAVAPGDTVIYDIVVTNTGNVPLTNVLVSDPALSFSTAIASLGIGAQSASEAFFTVPPGTAAGTKFFNTAFVLSDQTAPEEAGSEIIVAPVYSISIQKAASPTTAAPGATVNYTITVTNTSNAAITGVAVSDPTIGLQQTIGSMPANSLVVFEIPFTVPAGAAAGTVLNNIVSAVSDQTPVRTAAAQVTVAAAPAMTLAKTVSQAVANPGDTVDFTLVLTNTGNIALTNAVLVDSFLGINQFIPSLAVGQSFQLTAPYTVPASSAPGTIITNSAAAASNQTPAPIFATASVTVVGSPSIALTKTASTAGAVPGQTVTFTVSLTNASAIALTNVTIEDDFFGVVDQFPTLLPLETKVFTLDYAIPAGTPADTVFTNVAVARSDQTPEVSASAAVTVLPVPAIALTKTANVSMAAPGEMVIYTIVVTNTGNAPLHDVIVTDDNPPLDSLIPVLNQGVSATFVVPYIVPGTADPGSVIVDTATAVSAETSPVIANAGVLVAPLPSTSASIRKLVEPPAALPGEAVTYTIIVTNNTVVTLFNIHVVDPILGVDQTIASLDAGESIALLVPFVIPADAPAGIGFTNTATATVAGLSISASATVAILAEPVLALAKTPDTASALPGEAVNYTLIVTNAGNVPLTNVGLSDPQLGFATVIPALAAGESQSFVVPFVMPADPPGTIIANTASAVSGETPVPVQATAYVSVGAAATIAIAKTADPAQGAPGDVIAFTITITNTSAVTLTNVIVTDPLFGWFENVPSLPPGTSKTVVVRYAIPPLAPAGSTIVNEATVFSDQTLPASAEASVLVLAAPSLLLRKFQDNVVVNPGGMLIYTLELTNDGNSPLTGIRLIDPLVRLDETISLLQPQARLQLTAVFNVPADAPAGSRIVNVATASSDQTAPREAVTLIEVVGTYALQVAKTYLTPAALPGTPAAFRTEITNASNDALTNLFIEDPLVGLTGNVASLAPGGTIALESAYTVPEDAPVDSRIVNRIFVSSAETVVVSAESEVTVLPGPRLRLAKLFPSIGLPGQRVPVTLSVVNTGNLALHRVVLTDPILRLHVVTAVMQPDTVVTLNEFFVIPDDAVPGSAIVNRAEATSDETEPATASKELTVVGLLVEKSAEAAAAELKGTVGFVVNVVNPTRLPAHDVRVTDPLAPGTSLVAGSVTADGKPVPAASLNEGVPLGTLAPGASATVTFRVRIEKEQPNDALVNRAFAAFTFVTDMELRGTSASDPVSVEIYDNEE